LADGTTHTLDALSSGEKQLVLLLLEIMRRMNDGRIIMIDEPEISLHSTWQRALVRVLRPLAERYHSQVILATHSLEIVRGVFPEEVFVLDKGEVTSNPQTI
jgi:predicted ATPase